MKETENEWPFIPTLLATKDDVEKLIRYDIEHKDEEVVISASLGVFEQKDDDKEQTSNLE